MHADSVQVIANKDEKLELMSNKLDEVSLEKDILQNKFGKYKKRIGRRKERIEEERKGKNWKEERKELEELEIMKKNKY